VLNTGVIDACENTITQCIPAAIFAEADPRLTLGKLTLSDVVLEAFDLALGYPYALKQGGRYRSALALNTGSTLLQINP